MAVEIDEEVEAVLSGDDDPLERKVVGLPPLSNPGPSYFSFGPSSYFEPSQPPTDEEKARRARREALNDALAQAKHQKWTAEDIVAAARLFVEFLEHG